MEALLTRYLYFIALNSSLYLWVLSTYSNPTGAGSPWLGSM